MRLPAVLGVVALVCSCAVATLHTRNYDTHDYYAIHIDSATSPTELADALGLAHDGQLGELKDHHIFSTLRHSGDVVLEGLQELRRRRRKREPATYLTPLDGILFSQKQKLKPRLEKRGPLPEKAPPSADVAATSLVTAKPTDNRAALAEQQEIARSLQINDPIFHEQWHLFNPIQVGHDVNVSGLWKQGITGHNATVAIVDDGLDMYSDDLKENYFAEGSYDFNDKVPEPKPQLSDDRHGTRCAGEIAAVKNDVCGVGVAWDAKVAGIRILSKQISDADEAVAMNYAFQKNQIYSCSWGPPDDGQSMDAPGILIKRAMLNAVQNGRDKKGSIYVFASGNGAAHGDNCNFDGYTNSIYSITVGAVDRKGYHPYYSEKCCAQLVVTYSSGSGDAIVSWLPSSSYSARA
jgi:kexin